MLLRRAAWALVLLSAACAASLPSRSGGEAARLEPEARRAVAELKATYERAQAEEFFGLVDQSAFPDFSEFQDRIRQFLIYNHALNLDLIVDTVLQNGDEASVSLHWNKGFVDPSGRQQKANGECELLLRARPSGGLALIAIQGDSPF